MTPAALEAEFAPETAASAEAVPASVADDEGAEGAEDAQPADFHSGQGEGERRRRRRGRRGGRRRHRQGEGPAVVSPEGDVRPRLQLELRPGEPGYSGPAEEFGEEPDFAPVEGEIASDPAAESELPLAEAASPPPQPAAEAAEPSPSRTETPPHAAPENEPERAPSAYNVAPPQEVTGPAPNPRRGWWRR